jgi:1-acyl-sn-glycerol-3-phosphate acyltransferase
VSGRSEPERARSPLAVRLFGAYAARLLARRFDALRLLRSGPLTAPPAGPLVLFANHPSWWDALIFVAVARRLQPQRRAFAPMAAYMLDRYRFFRRIGAYPVALDRPAGARAFLEVSTRLLQRAETLLFVTPTGRFMDVRTRPLGFRPGLAHLAAAAPEASFVPLAIEYPFWEAPRPQALLAFGEPVMSEALQGEPRPERGRLLEAALERTMDRLADAAQARRADAFDVILGGRRPAPTAP